MYEVDKMVIKLIEIIGDSVSVLNNIGAVHVVYTLHLYAQPRDHL